MQMGCYAVDYNRRTASVKRALLAVARPIQCAGAIRGCRRGSCRMAREESLPAGVASPTIPSARIALTLLVLINLFNYIDRQVLAAVEPEIRRELLAGYEEAD